MAETRTQSPVGDAGPASHLLSSVPAPGVLLVELNAPKSRNSLSLALMRDLEAAIAKAGVESHVRAIVLAAHGPAFCAGHDLKEITQHRSDPDRGRAFYETAMGACASLMQAIMRCPKPVIAAVHATATAAGCQLVATCDLAVAADTAKFCTPGVDIGLFCSTPMVALSRNVPRKRAMEMLLLGELASAADAQQWGLVNRVVAGGREAVIAAAVAMAERIAAKSQLTVSIGKEAFYTQAETGVADAYAYAAEVMVRNMLARDAEEGIGAFLEKRVPVWTGT